MREVLKRSGFPYPLYQQRRLPERTVPMALSEGREPGMSGQKTDNSKKSSIKRILLLTALLILAVILVRQAFGDMFPTLLRLLNKGDEAVLIGYQESEHISAEEVGDLSGRFNYELVCDISMRVSKIYKQ